MDNSVVIVVGGRGGRGYRVDEWQRKNTIKNKFKKMTHGHGQQGRWGRQEQWGKIGTTIIEQYQMK